MERLARSDPGNADWQHDMALAYDKVGDVLLAQDNLAEALKSYRDELTIVDQLVRADPGNPGWQRDLSMSYEMIGDVQVKQGDLAAALEAYQASLAIRERLAQSNPGNAGWQRDLSVSYNKIGDVLKAQADLTGALKCYRNSLAIRQRLLALDSGNAQWQSDLRAMVDRIGGLAYSFLLARDFTSALDAADQTIALAPDLVWLYSNRAHALMLLGRTDEARNAYVKYRGEAIVNDGKSWESAILEDFAELRAAGLTDPLMDEIEKLFTSAG
jgi:tetratricopeptide (TPR) repeat protein